VRTDKALAIRDVIKVFRDEFKLPLILVGADDAVKSPELVTGHELGIQLGPKLVWYEKGNLINAPARFAYQGVPLALQTEAAAGSRYLPIHAVHAVRYGLDSESALQALTAGVAKLYKLDDRIGSLARGKDGDLVILSGDPFDLSTRVRAVVVSGRVVVDRRQ
jgi:imidazolonepropionase-like amidohydrolase